MSTRNISLGVKAADNLTTFMCRLSRNLGASTSWNPQGLSRTVMGLLYRALHTQRLGYEQHRKCTYKPKIEMLCHNGCCHWKIINITYSKCVSVVLGDHHAKCKHRIILTCVFCLSVPHFSHIVS